MSNIKNNFFDQIIEELWKIRNPHLEADKKSYLDLKKKILKELQKEKTDKERDLPQFTKKACFELSTARNRNLINIDEQNLLRETVVAFFGLSVGSHAALTWMMESRADEVKIIDPDTIAATNLNRMRNGWQEIGKFKVDVVKKGLKEMNPFANIMTFYKGSTQEMKQVFENSRPVDIIVDEIDNLEAKIILRRIAREKKIPLISVADVGDNIILDIERYDQFPQPDLFLGRISGFEDLDFSKLTDKEKKKLIIKLVGFEKNSEKMIDSLFAIGGSIVTWPQLGATATIAGGVIATTLKKIILGENVKSGRYLISLDDILVVDFNDKERIKKREKKINQIQSLIEK